MNLKDLIFGGGVKSGDDGGTYRDSIQAWLPIKNIIGGVVITKDGRFVKISLYHRVWLCNHCRLMLACPAGRGW